MAFFERSIIVQKEVKAVICHQCGESIESNPINLCDLCIQSTYDFSNLVTKTAELEFCSKCERYLDPPNTWIPAAFESLTLYRICEKKFKIQKGVFLDDHRFLWTEPHCKRIKLQLNVRFELATDYFIDQTILLEFIIIGHMCGNCHRVQAKDFWSAKVQIRQDLDHKKTFYYLEQLMLKNKATEMALTMKKVADGVDLHFQLEQHARTFASFVTSTIPCRIERSKKLRSHDTQSGVYDYKHTILITIVPVCKDNIVCLPPKIANEVGQISQLCLVLRVNTQIVLIDPLTAQLGDLNTASYWRCKFKPLCQAKQLIKYMVIEIDRDSQNPHKKTSMQQKGQSAKRRFKGRISLNHSVVGVWLQKSSEVGTGDMVFAKTHLGNLLKEGDTVQGFDLKNSNTNDENFDKLREDKIPDVIIVKKILNPGAPRKRRIHLRHLAFGTDDLNSLNNDYMDFLDDLEEDETMRNQLTIYDNLEDVAAADEAQLAAANQIANEEIQCIENRQAPAVGRQVSDADNTEVARSDIAKVAQTDIAEVTVALENNL